ncbi:MAG: hypothetical protein BWK76_02280 [Desulfobulbaceae bacterium A2]|nr:MAG: hypothetical protein BWK76_02280 [Desulfobulbaceae bacterium A2]
MRRALSLILAVLLPLPALSLAAPDTAPPPATESREYGSVEERRLLLSLEEERRGLAAAKESLNERENELKRLEAEVDKKLTELTRLRQELEEMLAQRGEDEQKRIKDLARMYEKMAPEKAARLIVSLDEGLAIAILSGMKTKAAAKLLNFMEKDKGAKLSAAFSSLQSP